MGGNKLTFGASSKGNPMEIYKRYEFVKHRKDASGNIQWRCKLYYSNKCQTRLTTKNDEIVMLTTMLMLTTIVMNFSFRHLRA